MSSMTVGPLTLREEKGAPLTNAEMDANLSTLRDFCNSLANLFGVAVNPDGSLGDNVVNTSQLVDRSVAREKLKLTALPFFVDTGAANDLQITPAPDATAYEDGMVFFIRVKEGNTGPTTLKVNALEKKPLRKNGVTDLDAGDLAKEGVVCVCYYGGIFHLVAGGASGSGSASVTSANASVKVFESNERDLMANAAFVEFTHSLGRVPNGYMVRLVCAVDDGVTGYTSGMSVDVLNVAQLDKTPAFDIKITDGMLKVTRLAEDLYASGTQITPANWKLRAYAYALVSSQGGGGGGGAGLNLSFLEPIGAVCYGNDALVLQRGNSGTAGTKVHLLKVDLGNYAATRVMAATGDPSVANIGLFRRASDKKDIAVYTTNGHKTYLFELQDPGASLVQWSDEGPDTLHRFKPAWIEGSVTHVYAIRSFTPGSGSEKINAVQLYEITPSGSTANYGEDLNLLDSDIVNNAAMISWHPGAAVTARMLFCQYNPVKGRLYVVTTESGLLHIFKITGVAAVNGLISLKSFWDLAPVATRAAALTYEKALALPFDGSTGFDSSSDSNEAHVTAIEVDLSTGQERSITLIRRGNGRNGVVTRLPWTE